MKLTMKSNPNLVSFCITGSEWFAQVTDIVQSDWLTWVFVYANLIQPLFEDKCYSCHNEDKQKGGLLMVTEEDLLRGGDHGAILERGGKLVDAVLGAHRFTEPISWLGKIRSKGVNDLGYGNVREDDWLGHSDKIGDYRKPTPLPKTVRCMAIAAVLGNANSGSNRLLGESMRTDGLVTEASALGRGHRANPDLNLAFTEETTFYNTGHVGLLSSKDVYQAILSFLTSE